METAGEGAGDARVHAVARSGHASWTAWLEGSIWSQRFITNVPGPVGTFRLAGAPLVAIWPVAVLAANVRLGVAAVSYAGRLHCGIHFDEENVPGATVARARGEGLARLEGRDTKHSGADGLVGW